MFIVTDDVIIYRDSGSLYPDRNDHIQIVIKDPTDKCIVTSSHRARRAGSVLTKCYVLQSLVIPLASKNFP